MSVSNVQVMVPPLRAVSPRTRLLADAIADAAVAIAATTNRWLERRVERAAAHRELRARAELIALARQYERSQPSFAKDLLVAAQADRG